METGELRQTANSLGRVAGLLAEESVNGGHELERLTGDLGTLRAAAEICRGLARTREARAAQLDDTMPLCLGCRHRRDSPGGMSCRQGYDTREAIITRQCNRYEAE